MLTKAAREFLTELADFPQKAIDSNWLQIVEADGQQGKEPSSPSSGQQIKAEAEKAKRVGNRRRRRCENFAPKAEVIGIIEVVDDVPAGSNLCQGFLAQQAPAFERFL